MAIDLDDLFAYTTTKAVLVRDRRLGLLYYGFVLSIFVYIIYTIVAQQLYLRKEPIAGGSIRFTIVKPPVIGLLKPNYCKVSSKCVYLSSDSVSPGSRDASLFITSALLNVQQMPQNNSCKEFSSAPSTSDEIPNLSECILEFNPVNITDLRFVAEIENYIITIEHSVKGNSNSRTFRNTDLKGTLLRQDNMVTSNPVSDAIVGSSVSKTPFYLFIPYGSSEADYASELAALGGNKSAIVMRSEKSRGDQMTVIQLLNAAGITSLDQLSDDSGVDKTTTFRTGGVTINIFTDYTNRVSRPEEIKYIYTASVLAGIGGKDESTGIALNRQNNISVVKTIRYGIDIRIIQTGTVGAFHFITLLTNLVASLALLGVATLIVEQMMIRVMPQRREYWNYKYEKTADFSDIRDDMQGGRGSSSDNNKPKENSVSNNVKGSPRDHFGGVNEMSIRSVTVAPTTNLY